VRCIGEMEPRVNGYCETYSLGAKSSEAELMQ